MNIRESQARTAASMYYLQNETMDTIAKQLGVSYSTVSRLLKYAREVGIVRITVADNPTGTSPLEDELRERFGINVMVVPVRHEASELTRLRQVSKVAAVTLMELMEPGMVLGVAWGNTTSEVARHLTASPQANTVVVQLNGAGNPRTSGIAYSSTLMYDISHAFDANAILFPVPAFFDFAQTKEAMWQERSVQRVLEWQRKAKLAIFSVGALGSAMPSHVYSGGYLEDEEIKSLHADGVVGDVCTVLLREDGTWQDISLNARATGPMPADLQTIPRRLCVVASVTKARALLGALRAGVATDLIVDYDTAREVLARAKERESAGGFIGSRRG